MVGLSIQYYLSFTPIISGATTLPNLFNQKIPDKEFGKKRRKYLAKDGVTIRDKEQLFYYEVYRTVIGVPCPATNPFKLSSRREYTRIVFWIHGGDHSDTLYND